MKKLFSLIMILLILSILFNIPQAFARTHSVTFTTGNIDLTLFQVRLDLTVSVQTNTPMVFSGSSGVMTVGVFPETTSLSIIFQGKTYTSSFPTPIGFVKIPITDILGLGVLYAKINGSIKALLEVEGPGSVSPTSFFWNSKGFRSISVSHTGSIFSFESFRIRISFSYIINVAVGVEALGITLYEYSMDIGDLSGTPIIIESIPTFSIVTVTIIGVASVIGVVTAVIIYRRRMS
ncbi:MAG: hypothetical protein QXX35_04750 [Desulfurococcaceae archaeon]